MRKTMKNGILLSSLLALSCCVSGVAVKTLGYETKAEGNDFFVNEANYTGSLTPGNVNFDTGFCSIPVVQGDNGWYVKGGPDMENLAEMTAQNNGNTYDDGKGYGFWWRQDYGIWGGGVLVNEWRSPIKGEVKFSGKILLNAPEETVLSLYHRATMEGKLETIYSSTFTAGTNAVMIQDENIKQVNAGESYYFVISQAHPEKGDAGKAHGRIHVKADFKAVDENSMLLEQESYGGKVTKENATHENGFRCVPDANTEEQGANNWYVAYGRSNGDYKKMRKEPNHWQGEGQYNSIWWGQDFSPDGGDAISVWKAPYNGKVKFSGAIYKDGMGSSDGVSISIHNRKNRFTNSEKLVQVNKTTDFILYINEKELDVVSGEMYFFSVNQLGNSAFDTTKVFIKAEFTKDEVNPGILSENEIEPKTINDISVQMVKGASIRKNAPTGIRFASTMTKVEYEYIKTNYEGVRFGMIIAPLAYYNETPINEETVFGVNNVYTDPERKEEGKKSVINVYRDTMIEDTDHMICNGVMVNVKEKNFNTKFVGIGYFSYLENGNRVYRFANILNVDGTLNEKDHSRSISEVAQAAINSGETGEFLNMYVKDIKKV